MYLSSLLNDSNELRLVSLVCPLGSSDQSSACYKDFVDGILFSVKFDNLITMAVAGITSTGFDGLCCAIDRSSNTLENLLIRGVESIVREGHEWSPASFEELFRRIRNGLPKLRFLHLT